MGVEMQDSPIGDHTLAGMIEPRSMHTALV
jgi:hypothetical protein